MAVFGACRYNTVASEKVRRQYLLGETIDGGDYTWRGVLYIQIGLHREDAIREEDYTWKRPRKEENPYIRRRIGTLGEVILEGLHQFGIHRGDRIQKDSGEKNYI